MSPKVIKNPEKVDAVGFCFRRITKEEEEISRFNLNLVEDQGDDSLSELDEELSAQFDIQSLVERAKEEADQIVAQARNRADQLERDAYAKGIEEGKKSGELIAQQQLEPVVKRFESSIADVCGMRDSLIQDLQVDFLELVVSTAEKVVKKELTLNPKAIMPMLREATHHLKQKQSMTIYLNPIDFPIVTQTNEGGPPPWLGPTGRVEEDRQLSRGSVRIQTNSGDLDASVETQFHFIRKDLGLEHDHD